jgi:hypothetical protein
MKVVLLGLYSHLSRSQCERSYIGCHYVFIILYCEKSPLKMSKSLFWGQYRVFGIFGASFQNKKACPKKKDHHNFQLQTQESTAGKLPNFLVYIFELKMGRIICAHFQKCIRTFKLDTNLCNKNNTCPKNDKRKYWVKIYFFVVR